MKTTVIGRAEPGPARTAYLLACFSSAQTTALLSFVTRTECESCRNYVAVAVRAAAVGGVARLMMMMTQLVQHLHTLVVVHYDD